MNLSTSISKVFPRLTLSSNEWVVLWSVILIEEACSLSSVLSCVDICYNSTARALSSLVKRNILNKKDLLYSLNQQIDEWIIRDESRPLTIKPFSNPLFDTSGFRKILDIYPKHRKNKLKETLEAWKNLNPSPELTAMIIEKIEQFMQSEDWKQDNGKWVPSLFNFIANERWRDEIIVEKDWRDM